MADNQSDILRGDNYDYAFGFFVQREGIILSMKEFIRRHEERPLFTDLDREDNP